MRSVVKHSFIKGMNRGARAKAHVNYIQYRAGEDREQGPRAFFNGERDNVLGREVKEQIDKVDARFIHKVILSPGVEGVDIQAYTKSIMTQLGKEKGLDLDWAAVAHTNTANDHAHVLIQGRDKYGKEVQLRLKDCGLMREYGDRYLEKHHTYERFLDRDLHNLLKEPDYSPQGDDRFKQLLRELKQAEREKKNPELAPQIKKGKKAKPPKEWDKHKEIDRLPADEKIIVRDKTYSKFSSLEDLEKLDEHLKSHPGDRIEYEKYQDLWSWIGTKREAGEDFYDRKAKDKFEEKQKKKERPPGEIEREQEKIDKDLKKSFKDMDREGSGEAFGKGYKQHIRETLGKTGADHGHFTSAQEIAKLEAQKKAQPERGDEIDEKINEIKKWDQEQRSEDSKGWKDLDQLLGDRDAKDRKDLAKLLAPQQVPPKMKEPDRLDQTEPPNRDLDSMLGDRYSLTEFQERLQHQDQSKELAHQSSQQQMRQFQDDTIVGAQTPELEKIEISRDDGEDLFSQGIVR